MTGWEKDERRDARDHLARTDLNEFMADRDRATDGAREIAEERKADR